MLQFNVYDLCRQSNDFLDFPFYERFISKLSKERFNLVMKLCFKEVL